jgi:hypothetical protein
MLSSSLWSSGFCWKLLHLFTYPFWAPDYLEFPSGCSLSWGSGAEAAAGVRWSKISGAAPNPRGWATLLGLGVVPACGVAFVCLQMGMKWPSGFSYPQEQSLAWELVDLVGTVMMSNRLCWRCPKCATSWSDVCKTPCFCGFPHARGKEQFPSCFCEEVWAPLVQSFLFVSSLMFSILHFSLATVYVVFHWCPALAC